jgi:hypothetical protein
LFYSFVTLALDGVGGQHHAPATFTPGKDPIPSVQEAGWAPGLVWIGVGNSRPQWDSIPRLAILTMLSWPSTVIQCLAVFTVLPAMYRVYCKCFKIRRKFDCDKNANLGAFLVHMFTCFVSCMISGLRKGWEFCLI